MQRHAATLALVAHLHFQSQHIAELSLERFEIGMGCRCRIPPASTDNISARPLFAPRLLFGLTNRQVPADDLARERFRIGSVGDGAGMAHADIAFQ